jgi:uncharacterized protein (TIGR03083 family)
VEASQLVPLFPLDCSALILPLHDELMRLLRSLSLEDWEKPTIAGKWRVRDVAAHLLDGQLRVLSLRRDDLEFKPKTPITNYSDLVSFLNQLNADWIRAAERLSPSVLIDMLALTGPQVSTYFRGLDPKAPAKFAVAWAGERESPNWFDIGREYTEHWHHQQQIRDATGRPLLLEPKWFQPLADICMRAVPHHYHQVSSAPGTSVHIQIAGDDWSLARREDSWELLRGHPDSPTATVSTDADTAWRIFFKALTREQALARIAISGDRRLGEAFCTVLAVMA